MQTLQIVTTFVSLVAASMTILGVGGIVSWSIVRKQQSAFAGTVFAIFAFSVKTSICLALLGLFVFAGSWAHAGIVALLAAGGGPFTPRLWDGEHIAAYTASYLLIGTFGVPMYLLISLSIYLWSWRPFVDFWHIFAMAHHRQDADEAPRRPPAGPRRGR